MAKTTAVLEGDSSQLVDAIKNAKNAMMGMDTTAKKLSDQLREVADDADKAAGVFITKLGGPNAIKAVAGIGAAFVGAQSALSVFSSSMSAFAQTQGAAGQKAMADLDMAINELQGQLFTAVMGTDDLEEAMSTLIGIVDTARAAFELVLTPVRTFSEAIRSLGKDHSGTAKLAREHADAEKSYKIAVDESKVATKSAAEAYAGVQRQVIALIGSKKEMAIFDLDQLAKELHGVIQKQDIAIMQRKIAAGDLAAAKAEATTREKLVEKETKHHLEWMEKAYADPRAMGGLMSPEAREAKARDFAENKVLLDKQHQATIEADGQRARVEAANRIGAAEAGFKEERDRLVASLKKLEEERQKLQKGPDDLGTPKTGTSGTSDAPEMSPAEKAAAELQRRIDAAVGRADKAKAQADIDRAEVTKGQHERIAMFGLASDEEVAQYQRVKEEKEKLDQEEFDKARQRAVEIGDLTFNLSQNASQWAEAKRAKEAADHKAKVDELTQEFMVYGQLVGQQVAAGKKASEIVESVARKAIGGQISALGDKAMAQASIEFWSGNFPASAGLYIAGTAAYATAAALGSTNKKSAAATPAAPAPQQQVNQSVSYNLQVDAAFANGESIARQFSMAQREATRRGMVPAGVF